MTRLQEINSEDLLREIKNRIERPPFQEKSEAKITDLKVDQEKLTAQLNDGREVSIPISLLTKLEILNSDTKPEQLKKYELWGEGGAVFFPDADETLPTWIIARGLNSC